MRYTIPAEKLTQLDIQLTKFKDCIGQSKVKSPTHICDEAELLRREFLQNEHNLHEKLMHSRSSIVGYLSNAYDEIESVIRKTQDTIDSEMRMYQDEDAIIDNKLLMAEYELDFSILAVSRALVVSLEAIAAQLDASNDESDHI